MKFSMFYPVVVASEADLGKGRLGPRSRPLYEDTQGTPAGSTSMMFAPSTISRSRAITLRPIRFCSTFIWRSPPNACVRGRWVWVLPNCNPLHLPKMLPC